MNALDDRIRLDFRSQEPIFQQIVRQVEKMVQDGVLKPGDQLPTVRQMAIDLRINFSTVARAYHILDEQKLISTQRGRGTYIWNESPPPAREIGRGALARELVQAFLEQASQKGFTLQEIKAAFDIEFASRESRAA